MIAIANLMLIQGWYPAKELFFSFNAVTWVFSAEVFFYLFFPLLIKDFENTSSEMYPDKEMDSSSNLSNDIIIRDTIWVH